MPKSSAHLSGRALTAVPYIALFAYGIGFLSTALGTRQPAFDDHPGQMFRLWHVVTLGPAPWAWNSGWWTGYPELQFYPPAFAYAGALLHWATFGALSVPGAYQVLLWLAYLAPGVTTLFALARVLGSPWLALPGAFVALTLSLWPALMSGVEGGVHVGMAPARLAWALLPLLLAVLVPWTDGGAPFPARRVIVLTAVVVLMHPAHLPPAVVILLLAALATSPRGRRVVIVLVALAVAAVLTAFWTLPLLARVAETRALAWGELSIDTLRDTLERHPSVGVLAVLALAAPVRAYVSGRPSHRLVAAFPWVMALVVAVDAAVLEPRGIRWLPADRVVDGFWLAVVLAAALAVLGMRSTTSAHALRRDPLVGVLGVALVALSSLGTQTLTLWPRPADWPSYESVSRGLRLPALWSALRETPPGRVLFVRSSVPLVYGKEWWKHTHVTALTPHESGRAIVNGTFTHPSPVAALLYSGSAERRPITQLVERLDGVSLFGRPLESLDAATLNDFARRLRVSTIVILEDDVPRLPALADNPVFRARRSEPPFVVWTGATLPPPERLSDERWRATLAPGADGWSSAGLAYYPLWRATMDGRPTDTRRGAFGDLEVKAQAGVVELRYGPGAPEIAGIVVSALGLLLCVVPGRYFTVAAPASEHS